MGKRTFLPRVTQLLLFGLLIGENGLDILPHAFTSLFGLIADMALVMVGFLLGSEFTLSALRNSRGEVLWISAVAAVVTSVVVTGALLLAGMELPLAILLGCIAAATDATAVLDVVTESGRNGHFSRVLLAIVALDDVWALLLFSIGMALVSAILGSGGGVEFLVHASREILGAFALGIVIGAPAAYLTGRVRAGQPIVTEALGLVFLSGGLAMWLEVSFLITAMTVGAMVANLARHHDYPFHAIEDVEQPFLVLFFILAGASLDFQALQQLGIYGLVYILARAAGKVVGGRIGGVPARAAPPMRRWLGMALIPQAGVAIGMGLVAANHFPQYEPVIMSLVIASTVFFEIVGPVMTRIALTRAEVEYASIPAENSR
jgi:Kef-type K+ transport system membrane component KefB